MSTQVLNPSTKHARAGADDSPLVSVGLPVFNGGQFLQESIDSLLGQSFEDFELLISDNASTDSTGDICTAAAVRDPRVRYWRQQRNIGAVGNWNFVVHAARGQFFKWASGNDYCAPTMVERCVRILQNQPAVVVCYGSTALVDEAGGFLGEYPHDINLLDDRPSVRFERVCRELRLNNAQSGLIRLDVLRRTGIERSFPGGDIGLMAELALYGQFLRLPEVLLYRRMGKASASRFLSAADRRTFLDPQNTNQRQMVVWQTHLDYVRSVFHALIGWREQAATLRFVLRSLYWSRAALLQEARDGLRGQPVA